MVQSSGISWLQTLLPGAKEHTGAVLRRRSPSALVELGRPLDAPQQVSAITSTLLRAFLVFNLPAFRTVVGNGFSRRIAAAAFTRTRVPRGEFNV